MKLGGVQLVLDTNVLVHWMRGRSTGVALRDEYELDRRSPRPIVPVVVKGEILSLARSLSWGDAKRHALDKVLRALPVADISAESVLDAYAMLDDASRRAGRKMGKNDLWVASIASVQGATVLTSEDDFDHLHPHAVVIEKYRPVQTPGP